MVVNNDEGICTQNALTWDLGGVVEALTEPAKSLGIGEVPCELMLGVVAELAVLQRLVGFFVDDGKGPVDE